MREAVSNLVDNAIKFTPAGGAVRIEARRPTGSPRLRERHWPRRPAAGAREDFRPLLSGERSGKSPGHGLGLSIAETIANLHGFKLTVEDNKPGARFELRARRLRRRQRDWRGNRRGAGACRTAP